MIASDSVHVADNNIFTSRNVVSGNSFILNLTWSQDSEKTK